MIEKNGKELSSIDNNVNKDINIQAKTNRVSRDIIENENDISNNTKTILVQTLIQLYRTGFRKLIPLHADSRRANVYDNLISEHEITQFPSGQKANLLELFMKMLISGQKYDCRKSHISTTLLQPSAPLTSRIPKVGIISIRCRHRFEAGIRSTKSLYWRPSMESRL